VKTAFTPREPAIALWGDYHFDRVSDLDMARFGHAYHCSARYHKNVKRKSGESFYQHDCRVASRILNDGYPIEVATAALLHEFPEDNGWSIRKIARRFGEEIAFLVDSNTKLPKTEFDNRLLRLENLIGRLYETIPKNWKVVIIRGGDRLDNDTDTAGLNEEDERRLFTETETHFLPLFEWAIQYIPKKFQKHFTGWILEIEFACDNYWRRQALRNS